MAETKQKDVVDDVMKNVRNAAETHLKMQREMFQTWLTLWPQLPASQSAWFDKVQDFQKQWTHTVSDLARKHREVMDRQYQSALESLEEGLRVVESKNPEEFRKRSEQLCRKTLNCLREISEAQIKEFQEAVVKWGETATRAVS